MQNERKNFKWLAGAPLAALLVTVGVVAGEGQDGKGEVESEKVATGEPAGSASQMTEERWTNLRQKTASVEEILGADVHNVGNPLGNVRDLVLSEDGSRVEYVLYEVPFPYAYHGGDDGFVAFDNLSVEPVSGFHSNVRIDDATAAQAPERLKLDRGEADHRLVSRLLGDTVRFDGDQTRELDDILVDRKTGEITGYVVNADPDAWFNQNPRVIKPENVMIGKQGDVTTTAEFAALESL